MDAVLELKVPKKNASETLDKALKTTSKHTTNKFTYYLAYNDVEPVYGQQTF